MKGIAIDYNGKTTQIAAGDGMLTISINDVNGKGYIYTAYTDYREQRRSVWHDHTPLCPGDRFHITVGEITPTPPVRSETDETIRRPISKLECFRRLEAHLKEKGLL